MPISYARTPDALPEAGLAVIRAERLTKTYSAGRGAPPTRALQGLDLTIHGGEIFGLLGPNGAGKSTTVKILSTLSRPDSGSAAVAGYDVRRAPQQVRRCIGLVSQRPSSAPMMTGLESLELAARVHGLPRRVARRRSMQLLERFDLGQAAHRLTSTYSGGMQRKLDVAIGLVARPQVLFLDEPTTGLDPEARAAMWSQIAHIASDDKTTVLLTTHYLEEADRLADRVAFVDCGRIVATGTPEELKAAMHGDGVIVELVDTGTGAHAAQLLSGVAGLSDVTVEGRTLRARADAGSRALPLALAALERDHLDVVTATVARPSLDDVYLQHTGHSFEREVAR